ncbi:MAG: branched-chain amino acid transport system permease protein [Thermodesulfobacteriota bacterium]|nr:branched-chain amino acid transport system permease protein [Thermodesulfobacteriota bacterium]
MNKPSRAMVSLTMLVVVFIALPWILPAYYLGLVTTSLILAILAMSANLLLGYLGLASVGQAAFFGIASYSVAIGVRQADFGSWSAVGTGLLAALCAGLVFGPLAIRTRDIFFLVIMLAFCQIMYGLTYSWRSITGGDDGLPGLLRPVLVPGVSFDSPVSYYFLALAVFLLVAGSFWLLVNSPFGLTLKGIRDSETRMRVLGYNVWFYKYIAFVVAALMGGISGILNAYYYGCPSPGDFSLIHSSSALLMVILGGPGTLFGPLVGSLLIVFIRDIVSSFTDRWLIVLGLAYVLTVLFCPDGLLGTFGKLRKKESDQRERPSGPQPSENTEDVGSPEPLSAQKS